MDKVTEIAKEKSAQTGSWVKEGLYYGLWMYVCMAIFYPLLFDEPYVVKEMILLLPFWIIAGLIYGFVAQRYFQKFNIKKKQSSEDSPSA